LNLRKFFLLARCFESCRCLAIASAFLFDFLLYGISIFPLLCCPQNKYRHAAETSYGGSPVYPIDRLRAPIARGLIKMGLMITSRVARNGAYFRQALCLKVLKINKFFESSA